MRTVLLPPGVNPNTIKYIIVSWEDIEATFTVSLSLFREGKPNDLEMALP
jgi:hypothetical protein